MNEINCLIEEVKFIDEKEFYVIIEIETKEKHFIPKNQIETFNNIEINKTYFFLKEYNKEHDRTYFSIIHPNYNIGKDIEFDIIETKTINEKLYFYLKSEYNLPLTIPALKWQETQTKIKCRIIGYKRGRPVLKNIDTTNIEWSICEVHVFKIKGYGKFEDRKGNINNCIKLELDESIILDAKCEKWHCAELWKFKDIQCKIIGILSNGLPKLIVFDNRHPLYEIGEVYKFIVKGFQEKLSYKGYNYKVIKLTDIHGDEFEVLSLPNQENKLNINDEIECEVINIDTRIHLKQGKIKDPFYYSFEEIIDDFESKNKYFINYLNDKNEFNLKLKSQYDQQSAFWVFTYCNYILTKIKKEESDRKNLIEVVNIIELHLKIEKWILSSGILKAINNDDERKLTKKKTTQIIDNNTSELFSINSIVNFKEKEFFEFQIKNKNFREIYYFLIHSNFANIDEINFMQSINKIGKIDHSNYHFVKKLINYIRISLELFKSSLQQEYFILSQNIDDTQKKSIKKYVNWIYVQLLLSECIGLTEEKNILLSKFYRFNTYLLKNTINNQKLLLNAFYVISNTDKKFDIPIIISSNEIKILSDDLENNPNKGNFLDTSKDFYLANIAEKHYNGYKLFIDETSGFLPTQNITDLELKHFNKLRINWETNIAITL